MDMKRWSAPIVLSLIVFVSMGLLAAAVGNQAIDPKVIIITIIVITIMVIVVFLAFWAMYLIERDRHMIAEMKLRTQKRADLGQTQPIIIRPIKR